MFTVYHSNQLDILKSLTAQLIKRQPLDNVFQPEIILVQSQGMGQWLQIQLADELGIAANIDYPFPTQFIWAVYRFFHPDLPNEKTVNLEVMTWILLAILPKLVKLPLFATLNHYFKHVSVSDMKVNATDDKPNYDEQKHDEQKYYQLARCIAERFDQYLVYRTDWLKAWEKNELIEGLDDSQVWQSALWQEVVLYTKTLPLPLTHRADIHMLVIEALKRINIDKTAINQAIVDKLPKRIFIFGIVSLPPLYLELFHVLSQYIDVHFMFMNPCRQYWGDIVKPSFLYNVLHKHGDTDPILELMNAQANPLLSSWGKLGRDHLALLQNYSDKQDIDAFADNDSQSLLALVQQSILDLQTGTRLTSDVIDFDVYSHEQKTDKQKITVDDDSIEFHVCHSEQREVEVLYDNLLAILDRNSDISPNDCVVMVADIDHYAPYIKAVFDNAPKQRYLPYTISDQKLRNIDTIIQGFLLLLDLPQSRLEIEAIFDLLDIPAIAKRFALSEENLVQLRHWIVGSGIRWGLESPIDKPHSWLMGLHRMLLGYVMESELDSWQGIFPYDEVTGLDAELIGLLADFVMTMVKWCNILAQSHVVAQWQDLCTSLLADFFIVEPGSEPLLMMIEEQWKQIMQQAILAGFDEKISVMTLKNMMQAKFDNHYLSHRFLVGKINFCTMMPMRSVPFKVVCLLGMNDGVYPRISSPLSFDLISRHGRIGDRNRRSDDRYLFLEALLSAQKKLYISYIGRDIQTNDERYPSVLVDELFAYLKQHYLLSGDELLVPELSGEKWHHHLLHFHTRTPFNIRNFLKKSTKTKTLTNADSYAVEWLPAAKRQGKRSSFYEPLNQQSVSSITLDDLKRFYLHPIKELARKRLGYLIDYTDEQLPDSENFNLDGLQRYHLNYQIVNKFMEQNAPEAEFEHKLYQKMLLSNQLPYEAFGQILYAKQKELMQSLINKVDENRQGSFSSIEVNLSINNIELNGRIKNVQADGILQWRSAKLTVKDGIALWIDHLVFCAQDFNRQALAQHEFHSRLYGRDDTSWCFKPLTADHAVNRLSELVDGYVTGFNQPFFMPLQSSWCWLETVYDVLLQKISADPTVLYKARRNFISRWQGRGQGNVSVNAECDDYYYRLYPELTDELIDIAIGKTITYLLPLIEHQQRES